MHLKLFMVRLISSHIHRFCFDISGTQYQHGSIAQIIYVSSGSSADWTYGAANVTFSYGVELRDTGKCN
jgi:Zinc carboxypeptidase